MDNFKRDFVSCKGQGERLVPQLVQCLGGQDPLESIYALSLVSSHMIALLATDGSVASYARVHPVTRDKLLEQVLTICQDARAAGQN